MLLKKCLHRLSELSDLKLLFTRYFVNLIVLLEVLSVPLIVEPSFYTDIEFLRYSFMLVPIFLLGSYSGYLHIFYNKGCDYRVAMISYSVVIALICSVLSFYFFKTMIAAIATFFVVVVLPLEKVLITKNQLILASIYKSLISTVVILLCLFLTFNEGDWSAVTTYSVAVIFGSVAWIGIIYYMASVEYSAGASLAKPKLHLSQFIELCSKGFVLNAQSYILVAYFLFDRYFTNTLYSSHSAEFAIAFSLSQIVFIGINTIAFSAQQKIGVEINTLKLSHYSRYLKITGGFFSLLIIIGLMFVLIFSHFIEGYGQFFYSFFIVASGVGGYYLLSSFSVVAFYKGLANKMFFILLIALIVNLVASYFISELGGGYYINLVKSVVVLLCAGFFTDFATRKVLV